MFTEFFKMIGILDGDKTKHCDHNYNTEAEVRIQLTGGRHTSFVLLTCKKCDYRTAFPIENLQIATKEGTKETKEFLKEFKLTTPCPEKRKK